VPNRHVFGKMLVVFSRMLIFVGCVVAVLLAIAAVLANLVAWGVQAALYVMPLLFSVVLAAFRNPTVTVCVVGFGYFGAAWLLGRIGRRLSMLDLGKNCKYDGKGGK
jgi:hypothetical protein